MTEKKIGQSDLFQVHASSLSVYGKCGIQARKRYIEKIPTATSGRLVSGSAAHYARERDLTWKALYGELVSDEEIKNIAAEDFAARWEREDEISVDDEVGVSVKQAYGKYLDRAVRLAWLHHVELAPELRPAMWKSEPAIEVPFSLPVKGTAVELVGRMDLIENCGPELPDRTDRMERPNALYRVRDQKNVAKSPPKGEIETLLQGVAYCSASESLFGAPPMDFTLDASVDTKTPKIVTQSTRYGPGHVEVLANRLVRIDALLQSGDWAPADPSAWWCSKKWCGYWRTCEYALRPVSTGGGS